MVKVIFSIIVKGGIVTFFFAHLAILFGWSPLTYQPPTYHLSNDNHASTYTMFPLAIIYTCQLIFNLVLL